MKREASSPLAQPQHNLTFCFLFLIFFSFTISSADAASASFYEFIFSRFSSPSTSSPSDLHAISPPKPPLRRDEWDVGAVCNCSSDQACCYWSDLPFCCGLSTTCCGSLCCPS